MCLSASQHEKYLKAPNLDTLTGFDNKHRRVLKRAYDKQDGKCYWCSRETFLWWEITTEEFKKIGKPKMATREHMVPKSEGGVDQDINITSACHRCNSIRGTISVNQFKWVTSTPKRLKRLLRLKQEKKAEKNRLRRASQIRHAQLMASHAVAKKEKNLAKSARIEIGVNYALISYAKDMRNIRNGKRIYPIPAMLDISDREFDNKIIKFTKQMRFQRHNWIRSHRAFNVVLLNYMLWRYPSCQEPVKNCLPKVETLSFVEKVKRFFAKVNLKMVSLKHAHRSFALQSRKSIIGDTFK